MDLVYLLRHYIFLAWSVYHSKYQKLWHLYNYMGLLIVSMLKICLMTMVLWFQVLTRVKHLLASSDPRLSLLALDVMAQGCADLADYESIDVIVVTVQLSVVV